MQIIGEVLHVQDAYNFVIYHPGVELLLIIYVWAYQSLNGIIWYIASTPFYVCTGATQRIKTDKYMNDYACPCLMKADLEQSVAKISFLKEYYPGIESPGYIEALPKQELLCCLCLLDSILFSIEQEHYICTITELIRLYRSRERVVKCFL